MKIYYRYGGRGITVCEEWNDFENFYQWAIKNNYKPGLTIDRINNDDGYYPLYRHLAKNDMSDFEKHFNEEDDTCEENC